MSTTHTVRRLLACAALAGALTTGAAGIAQAHPHANPSPRNGSGDTTGWHHIDRYGYHHQDSDSLKADEHDDALRDYRRDHDQPAANDTVTGSGPGATWSQTQRPDGSGYTVCRPQASWCR